MKVAFEMSFARDLRSIRDKAVLERIDRVIQEIKNTRALNEIRRLGKMRGHPTFYRLRVGDYRIGLEVMEDTVIFVRVLHRKDIYKYFP